MSNVLLINAKSCSKMFNILLFYCQDIVQEWLFELFLKSLHLAIMVQLHSPNVPQKILPLPSLLLKTLSTLALVGNYQ
jgi:hypothetical protein